jgi:hypothetical protein
MLSIINVSVQTVGIVEGLPKVNFELDQTSKVLEIFEVSGKKGDELFSI